LKIPLSSFQRKLDISSALLTLMRKLILKKESEVIVKRRGTMCRVLQAEIGFRLDITMWMMVNMSSDSR